MGRGLASGGRSNSRLWLRCSYIQGPATHGSLLKHAGLHQDTVEKNLCCLRQRLRQPLGLRDGISLYTWESPVPCALGFLSR